MPCIGYNAALGGEDVRKGRQGVGRLHYSCRRPVYTEEDRREIGCTFWLVLSALSIAAKPPLGYTAFVGGHILQATTILSVTRS